MQPNPTLLHRIRLLAGLADDAEARTALRATLAALGDVLTDTERRCVAQALPYELARDLHAGDRPMTDTVDDLIAHVAHYEHVEPSLALAHAQATCRALGDELDPDSWRALLRVLPDVFLELFRPAPEPPRTADLSSIAPSRRPN